MAIVILNSIAPIQTELSILQTQAHESIQQLAHQGQPLAIAKLRQQELEQNPSVAGTDATLEQLAQDGDPVAITKLTIEGMEKRLSTARSDAAIQQVALEGNPAAVVTLGQQLEQEPAQTAGAIESLKVGHIDQYV